MDVNWLAVFLAALSAFVLGGLWYGPLFGKSWQTLQGLSDEQMKNASMALIFGGSFALSLLAAFVFAMFLGREQSIAFTTAAGFGAGFAWVAASLGIHYLFARKPFKLWLIDGGYSTLQFTLYGLILGLMN